MSNHQLSGSPIFQTNPACTSKSPALVDILLNRVLTCETTGNRFYEFCQSYCTILDLYAWLPHFFNGLGMVLFSCSHLSTVDAPWMESWDVSPMRIWLKLITQKKKITWVSLALLGQREAFLPLLMDWGIRMSQDPTVVALENDLNISTGSCQSTFPMARLRMCKHDVKARFKFGCHTRVGRWWMASGHYNNVIDVSSHWLPVSKAIVSGTPNVLHGKWNLPIQLWSNCSACLSLCVILWCHVHTCICHISSSVFLIWCPFSTVEYICLWWLSSHLWDKPPYWPLLVCLWWQ